VIGLYQDEVMGDMTVSPDKGNVAMGSGLIGWAFTLRVWARMYASKFGIPEEKMMARLWGDNYYDPEAKKWTNDNTSASGKALDRGFVQFVLKPLLQIFDNVTNEKKDELVKMLAKLNITLSSDALEQQGRKLMRAVMQKFLPAADALLEMIVINLPNPRKAQSYRVVTLYDGDLEDKVCFSSLSSSNLDICTYCTAVISDSFFSFLFFSQYAGAFRKCEQDGPLIMYVSKMVPTSDNSRFFAFGRVFSGTIRGGQKVRIMGSNYTPGRKEDVTVKSVQRTVLMMGRFIETVEAVSCGNVVGLVGVDSFIVKTATIVDEDAEECAPLKAMKYSVSPVVRVAVEPKNPADLPKLVEGLKRLAKSDPLVQIIHEESGEHIVAGAGELHLEICLKDLQDDFMNGAPLKISEPVVPFRETVMAESRCASLSSCCFHFFLEFWFLHALCTAWTA
jgi:elongation factor 2